MPEISREALVEKLLERERCIEIVRASGLNDSDRERIVRNLQSGNTVEELRGVVKHA